MNLVLKRTSYCEEGIFGMIVDEEGNQFSAYTLEHAYVNGNGGYYPKLAPGTYVCVRGMHQLAHMNVPFETFEVDGVPDFLGAPVSGILFHVGNYNQDSEGCILLGLGRMGSLSMITESKDAFQKFMELQEGINTFYLVVG